jgi:histidinol dehydrogenase
MEIIKYPLAEQWPLLVQRPVLENIKLDTLVEEIFKEIRLFGDEAIKKYSAQYDKYSGDSLVVSAQEIKEAIAQVPEDLKRAISIAKSNIEKFHQLQWEPVVNIETTKGVTCWRESRPIERVGIYTPGGTAPLFSTVLMLGIPAKIAGCNQIVLCTPPGTEGKIAPVILYTAQLLGINSIFRVGGIQAIGAMTFGSASIPRVDKLFGPGNQYLTAAKTYAQKLGVAIDMPAGPSEVLIIADQTANPAFVAADLLAQAEHGPDSQVMLVTNTEDLIEKVLLEIEKQQALLPRIEFIQQSLQNSKIVLMNNLSSCIDFSNAYAPEHLILAVQSPRELISKVTNAGSVFLGNYSCESAGDYASGTNHTLPTNSYARSYSGVSLDSFLKKITFQELSEEGILNLGPTIECMADAEKLQAHKNAVSVRIKTLQS